MNYYVVSYELSDDNDCKCRGKGVIEKINSYPGSTKLLDNTYYISSFQDMSTVLKNLSDGLNDDDKMAIVQVNNIIGKRIPNI